MTPSEMANYYLEKTKNKLKEQFEVYDSESKLQKSQAPQPGAFVSTTPIDGPHGLTGRVVGCVKGMLISVEQPPRAPSTSNDPDLEPPLMKIIFYVPLDSDSARAEKATTSLDKKLAIRVEIMTNIAEKFLIGGQDQFRKPEYVAKDLVAILSGEEPAAFGKASFDELYKKADARYESMYNGATGSTTSGSAGLMRLLLEITGQTILAETGMKGSGAILNGDYGLYTANIFADIEEVKAAFDTYVNAIPGTQQDSFQEMAEMLKMGSFTTGASFSHSFEDFKTSNLSNFILAGRETTTSLFFNPEIKNSIYEITEAGASDPREGFVENIIQQDQLGAAERLVASSLLGGSKVENTLKIDQVKRIANTLYKTQAYRSTISKDVTGLSRDIISEMSQYQTAFKRILSRAGSILV
jgi:hypothetical protein